MAQPAIGEITIQNTAPTQVWHEYIPDAQYYTELPYQVRVVFAGEFQAEEDHNCEDVPILTRIRLYQGSQLVQELPTESQGTCSPFFPEIADLNFDGYPDIMLALHLPAGPNIPYQSWLYTPQTQRFDNAPKSLQEISSPRVDAQHQTVYSFWRAGAASHGVDVYKWTTSTQSHMLELVLIDTQTSYFMPLRIQGEIKYCYTVPFYDSNTGEIVYSNALLEQPDGSIVLTKTDIHTEDCLDELVTSPAPFLSIHQADGPPRTLNYIWTEHIRNGQSIWYPLVPYYDIDTQQIGWQIIWSISENENPLL